ncbi:fungal-specific transcription factor domain-containing protein [Lasiosphaeria miniovina]|uniref:Fungal-specific transcription factor domain-containing protein n=1 Tax=Lasiosphaeria miniovina TaxID=1954250 RepID=A0AA40ADE0_9PEZI|nr:fungal-specific transcription factor domain-containing protein [Lasiosphaeria miniovina]KAK0713694.1 fungal-specific transcription factor domain-containing protein [Lasiosphaeria miniovina]
MDLTAPDSFVGGADHKKRTRIRFSCTSCRGKKLKCDRQSPCDQCIKRGLDGTCQFIPYVATASPSEPAPGLARAAASASPRGIKPATDSALQARLKHLEHIVQVLKSQRRWAGDTALTVGSEGDQQDDDYGEGENQFLPRCLKETAGLVTEDQRYIDNANWEAILDHITTLTSDLHTFDDIPDDIPDDTRTRHFIPYDYASSAKGPVLFSGVFPRATVAQMAFHLPPRPVADRLISALFETKEPSWVIFHVPSFLRDYNRLWENPSKRTYASLALHFSAFSLASLYILGRGEEMPGNLGPARAVFESFKAHAAHCLALSDYTKPGCYKIEALIMLFGCEFVGYPDAVVGSSMLLTITIRLAMHMGMHRDGRHYPKMSPFTSEMRRRKWAMLREIDRLLSFHFGLPSNIHDRFSDTEPPRNLHDEDFDEETEVLPPSRPFTERTTATLIIFKSRLGAVFGEIIEPTSSPKPMSHADTLRLDARLQQVHDNIPAILQYRPPSESLADPVDLFMQRYLLDLIYLKARMVLHRSYLGLGRLYERYADCRRICLESAMLALQYQYEIHVEVQPDGRLAKDRWFLNSLSVHDFLLADMILCLELSYLTAKEDKPGSQFTIEVEVVDGAVPDVVAKEKLLELLETSRLVWQAMRHQSTEANRGFKILSKMLNLSMGATGFSSESSNCSPESQDQAPSHHPQYQTGTAFFSIVRIIFSDASCRMANGPNLRSGTQY